MDMPQLGRILVIVGVVLVVTGGVLLLGSRIPILGHLPGDVRLEGDNVTVYLLLGTSIVVSIVLTIALNLIARWMGR
jgi:hypothetical protein